MDRVQNRGRAVTRPLQDMILRALREWYPAVQFTVPEEPYWLRYLTREEFRWRNSFPEFGVAMSSFDRVIVVGSHGRRIIEATLVDHHELIEWLSDVDEDTVSIIETAAVQIASFLDEQIVYWSALETDPAIMRDATLAIAMRRDELESIAWMLERVGGGRKLAFRLAAFDEVATAKTSVFQQVGSTACWWVAIRNYFCARDDASFDYDDWCDDYHDFGPAECPHCHMRGCPGSCRKIDRRRDRRERRDHSPGSLRAFIRREYS